MPDSDKGLRGVVAVNSGITSIDGERGILRYRGYDVGELVEHCCFEEVCFLLLHGELPTAGELASFRDDLLAARTIPTEVEAVVDDSAHYARPMEAMRSMCSALSFSDPDKTSNELDANLRKATRLISQVPTVMARYRRRYYGLEPVQPDPELDYSTNFLWMLRGELPSEEDAKVLDGVSILHADHEMNASTFAARVIAATCTDMHSAIVGAIAALKGPLHGGANEWVMATLKKIGSEDKVEAWVDEMLDQGKKIPGFGHAIYKVTDPRAIILKEIGRKVFDRADTNEPNWFAMTERMERRVFERKGLVPNVDLYSASVLYSLGFPIDLLTALFAANRVAGWSAHVIEQHSDNRIIRPTINYTGPPARELPVSQERA
ncbi:MAG TPA: citrate/2-methylcitrate synthase [Gaiellaceae bacterium]|jgi:citrate synthase